MLLGEGKEFTLKMTAGVVLAMAGFAMYSHSKIQRLRDVQPRCARFLRHAWARHPLPLVPALPAGRVSQLVCQVLVYLPAHSRSFRPADLCRLSRVISLTASGNGSSPELVPLKVGDMSTMHRVASSNGSSMSQV